MKEYKLSAKSKFSVLYLLSGLFMFFFMFAIFNLSSYAISSSVTVSTDGYFEYSIPLVSISASSTQLSYINPYTDVSGATSISSAYNTFSNVVIEVHFVTSYGDFVVCGDLVTSGSTTYSHSVQGVPVGYYAIIKGSHSGTTSQALPYSFTCNYSCYDLPTKQYSDTTRILSNTNDILSILNDNSAGFGNIYNSYVPVSIARDCSLFGNDYKAGDPCVFDVGNVSLIHTYPNFTNFFRGNISNYMLVLDYDGDSSVTIDQSRGSLSFYQYGYDNTPSASAVVPTSDWNGYFVSGSNHHTYICFFNLDDFSSDKYCGFYFLTCYSIGTMQNLKIGLYQSSYTIGDYMNYVQNQWGNISPSVIDTNSNIAQSVSDIGTAQTFETSAFDNFNTQFSSSGLDTFSMSFASTPLLWVSSIITTFYNYMPSTFQYLLMFVAFVGILCTVLNVFGRVAQRFGGGDNATKLNSKDVFSKIEKNGSI